MPKNSNRSLRRANRARVISNRSSSKQLDGWRAVEVPAGKLSKNRYTPEYGAWWKDAKDWKLLWRRGQKNRRAQQLGFEHPRKNWRTLDDLFDQSE